mgnify:FL=1
MELSRDSTPAQILRDMFALRDRLMSPGSTSGHQGERARQGLSGPPPDGARVNTQEIMRARYGDLLLLVKDLTEVERECCRLRYGTVVGVETHEALRRAGDVLEGDGEVVVDAKPKDLDGVPMDGWVRVRGPRSRYPSFGEIARETGLTARQVQRHLEDARSKIETAKRWRLFASAQESRYT